MRGDERDADRPETAAGLTSAELGAASVETTAGVRVGWTLDRVGAHGHSDTESTLASVTGLTRQFCTLPVRFLSLVATSHRLPGIATWRGEWSQHPPFVRLFTLHCECEYVT